MCPDAEFDEDASPLVYGPIQQAALDLLVQQAAARPGDLGVRRRRGLQFTLFRPFNWFGPHLDDIDSPKEGSSRVLTQFLHNILYGEPIKLVDGGTQRRSFTYISDGIDALMAILENRGGAADGGIFNIGNPANDLSIRELAERHDRGGGHVPGLRGGRRARRGSSRSRRATTTATGYQDILTRVPSIRRARKQPRLGAEGLARGRDPPDRSTSTSRAAGPRRDRASRRPQGRLRHARGDPRGRSRACSRCSPRAGSARRSSSRSGPTARASPSGASSRSKGFLQKMIRSRAPVALRLADDALRDAAPARR